MLGSGGRESVQVLSQSQDSLSRMQGPALGTHSLADRASTTVTVQNQGTESDLNTQRDSSGFTNSKCTSPYLLQNNTSHRPYANSSDSFAHYDTSRCATTNTGSTMIGGALSHATDNTISCGDDLTSLTWLHSLDMGGMVPHLATPPTPPASPQPHNPLPSHNTHTPPSDRKRKIETQDKLDRIDYSQDGSAKPPYSYAALIGMAMKENQNKMTLSAIYKWIKENFAYYKTADPSWQNSIRHNLSLNKCFLKVPRSKDEPGKGGFWRLDPEYADSLVDGVFKKRRPTRHTLPPPSKSKRNRRLPCNPSQQQQQQVDQRQQLGVKVLLQQPQAAFMPPPTNKPPPRTTLYIAQDGTEVDRETGESANSLKDELVWSTILGEEVNDDAWPCRTQELVTDLSQTGDPSTYPTTLTTSNPHQHNLPQQQMDFSDHLSQHHHHQVITITTSTTPSLPSLELSPASLGVEEDLFTSPDCSEASNDDADSLTSSLEINNDGSWSKGVYEELPSMNTFCNSLTQLRPLEPSTAPVLVQDAHAWGPDTNWDDSRTLSLLDANLDLENLIDLDEL